MPSSKLLIANRGEIAIRIMRAAGELDIRSVAVFSEDDARSLHTRKADEAHPLRGKGAAAYLDIDQIVAAAKGRGCDACGGKGVKGRVGIYEMMPLTTTLKRLITADCDIGQLRRQAIAEGMRPLRLNGAQKVANGLTTIEEVMKVAPPEALDM